MKPKLFLHCSLTFIQADNMEFKSLEHIITVRRTTRSFSGEFLSNRHVDRILKSAIYAPFGGATGLPLKEIRKVFVFKTDSEAMRIVDDVLITAIRSKARQLGLLLRILPFLKRKLGSFHNRLKAIGQDGIPSFKNGSHFIIIAERKGIPAVQRQSIAHALQNMWLSATSVGAGFQLITATGIISNHPRILKLLNLPRGKYQLDGCIIGIPVSEDTEECREMVLEEYVTRIA